MNARAHAAIRLRFVLALIVCVSSASAHAASAPRLAPLLPEVTVETLAQLAGFAMRDRMCLRAIAESYDVVDAYKSCMGRVESVDYCQADADILADLRVLVEADPRLQAQFGNTAAVVAFIGSHCADPSRIAAPLPRGEVSAALDTPCATVMPVLIAHAITLRRSEPLCRSSVGKFFIEKNCDALARYARLRNRWPAHAPVPRAFGVEPYFCPDDFQRLKED
jgi:hypothetical protein